MNMKKLLVCTLIGIFLGFVAPNSNASQEEYNNVIAQQESVKKEIVLLEETVNKEKLEISNLEKQKEEKDKALELIRLEEEKAKAEEEAKLEEEKAKKAEVLEKELAKKETDKVRKTTKSSSSSESSISTEAVEKEPTGQMVWQSATGSKYHNKSKCGNMNPAKATQITVEQAKSRGLGACKKCF